VKLTVTICTHNRCNLLARTIQSLEDAVCPPGLNIELLVIANACTDDTEQWLQEYGPAAGHPNTLPLTWDREPQPGKSHALNLAINLIKTAVVVFVDDDHRVPGDFFESIDAAFRGYPDATMFCGCIRPDWDGREPNWIHDNDRYPIYPKPVPHFEPWSEPRPVHTNDPIPGGGNLIMYTSVLQRTGEFSTDLGPSGDSLAGSEDTDYVLRALAGGESLMYVPSIRQYHYVELDRLRLGYLVRKSFERSKSVTRVREREQKVPAYQWRKLATYLLMAMASLSLKRSRFYLVRTAAVLGEISAALDRSSD